MIVLVHDANKDKKDFYKKVSVVTGQMVAPIQATKKKAIEKAKKIDILIASLERLSEVLHAPREYGLTLQKMYSKSKAIQSASDERYPLFRHFKANAAKLPKFNFEKITEAVAHLINSKILREYVQLRSMAEKNPAILKLRSEFDMFHAMEALGALDYQDMHLAVKRVTENRGKKTPGVDGILWKTDKDKCRAVKELGNIGYMAEPLRRVFIPKKNGKKRPLGIPTMKDRTIQALHLQVLDPIAETTLDGDTYGFRKKRGTADTIRAIFGVVRGNRHCAEWVIEGDNSGLF